jgi:hypothetical protein
MKKIEIQTNKKHLLIRYMSSKVINYSEINVEYISFKKLEENDKTNGQLIGFPQYNNKDEKVSFQSPWFKLFTYGVPQLNQYYKTDNERAHVRLPIDLSNPEHVEFVEKIKAIDEHMSSEEMKDKLLGKKGKKYKYQPIYREAQVQNDDDDDDEEVKKPKKQTAPRPPYIKLKIHIDYNSREVKTKVLESEVNSTTNKRERTELDYIKSIDDFASVVKYQSSIRCIFNAFKCWAHPLTKKDPEYGISLRLEKVEVEKSTMGGKYPLYESANNFIDSDTEVEIPQIKSEVIKNNDSDSSDEDEDEITKPKVDIAEVDSDSSDEEFIVKAKPKKVISKSKK